jgi:hypothetical protein
MATHRFRRQAAGLAIVLSAIVSSPTQLTASEAAGVPSWWQVSCEGKHHSDGHSAVYLVLRHFPITSDSLENPSRFITFWSEGFQFHAQAARWNLPWSEVTRVSVRSIGSANAALVLTVAASDSAFGENEVGGIEPVCWREIERMVACYTPSIIEGSPPLNRPPLHDAAGHVVPEPKYPNPYCPNK